MFKLINLMQNAKIAGATAASKNNRDVAFEVIFGKWGSGTERKKKLTKAGYNYNKIQSIVNDILKKKPIDTVAREVIDGKWGSGKTRKERLVKVGYNYNAVQKRVNEILNPPKPSGKKYDGPIPTLRIKKTNAEVIADTIKWAKWIAGDNRFHYGYGKQAHHNGCYFCGTQYKSGKHKGDYLDVEYSYCCNPFVHAAWAHGGCVPKAIEMCRKANSWGQSKSEGYEKSSLFTKLGKPKYDKLKAGDVLCSESHVALYVGNGKVAQAANSDDNKRNSAKWNNSIRISTWNGWTRAYRFNGSVDADILMRHGEVSKRVAEWQAFLDWYFDGKVGKADGYFGDNTLKWTKKFQEEALGKGQGDGICGDKTFAAARKVEK